MLPLHVLLVLLLPLLFAADRGAAQTVPAAAALRARLSGTVTDQQGGPWAGARVVLVSQPLAGLDDGGPLDRLEVTADDQGRFRAEVLRHREYTAWARSPAVADDGRVSVPVEGASGDRIELHEAAQRARPIRLDFGDLAAWREFAPLRVRVVPAGRHRPPLTVPLDAEWRGTLPPLPGEHCRVEVIGKGQHLIHTGRFRFAMARLATRVPIQPPRDWFVEVRDGRNGKGIAGAQVFYALRGTFYPLGKTDADGVARLRLAARPEPGRLVASAAGFALGQFRLGDVQRLGEPGWKPLRGQTGIVANAVLGPGARYTGQVCLAGRPVAGVTLLYQGQCGYTERGSAHYVQSIQRVLHSDPDGRFVVDGCAVEDDHGGSVDVVLTPEQVASLPPAWHRQVHPRVIDVADLDRRKAGRHALPALELDRLCPIMLEVSDPGGLPIRGAEVAVGSRRVLRTYFASERVRRTDRLGRLCLLTRPTAGGVLVIRKGGAFAARRLAAHSGPEDHAIVFLRHQLARPWEISGTVVNRRGDAIPGMSIGCFMEGNDVPMPAAEPDDRSLVRDGRNRALLGTLDPELHDECMRNFIGYRMRSKTDARGRFAFQVPPIPMRWMLAGHRRFLFFNQDVGQVVRVTDGSRTGLQLRL